MTTPADTGTLLLRAVLDSPDDDTPRLVLADWLEEHSFAERAEFIRVQVELARRRASGDGYRLELVNRELELFAAHGADWFGPTGCLTPPNDRERAAGGTFCVVRRGFVSHVTCTLAAFVGGPCGCNRRGDFVYDGLGSLHCPVCRGSGTTTGIAAALFAAHPVTGVTLTDREPTPIHHSGGYRPPSWHNDPDWQNPGYIPTDLYDAVRRLNLHHIEGPGPVLSFEDEATALSALSRACVLYGRSLAGLSDLTPDQIQ